jgi:large subunit ribosomal protein L11
MAPVKKGKEIKNNLTLQIQAAVATPAPPLGPILGQNGISIQEFVNEFNQKTQSKAGDVLPVKVVVFKDGSYKMTIKEPTVAGMLKKAANIQKGSANAKKDKVGKVNSAKVKEIAERKMTDLNTPSIDSAIKIVEGTARSLGIEVV